MVEYFLNRPVSVLMSVISLLILGTLSLFNLPVQLVPDVEVPKLSVNLRLPNASAEEIESSTLKQLRTALVTMPGLDKLSTTASKGYGTVSLEFLYQTNMALSFIELNERIDEVLPALPQGMDRPSVNRTTHGQIPVVRLQMTPKGNLQAYDIQDFALTGMKRHLESKPGISLVDVNGVAQQGIVMTYREAAMESAGVAKHEILSFFAELDKGLNSLSVRDGNYEVVLSISEGVKDITTLQKLPIKTLKGDVYTLGELCEFKVQVINQTDNLHHYNQEQGIVFSIYPQPECDHREIVKAAQEAIVWGEKEAPSVTFSLTQDQSALLNLSIGSLQSSLALGGIAAVLLLLLFMKSARSALVLVLFLPTTIFITFLVFYLVDLTINIISLSGLIIGVGLLIDNGIIIVDRISDLHETYTLREAIRKGTTEMISPLLSSTLTTLVVFIPPVFLGGIQGELFKNQSLAIAIILGVSLLVSFIGIPTMYYELFKNKQSFKTSKNRQDKRHIYYYHQVAEIFQNRGNWVMVICILFIGAGFLLMNSIPSQRLPNLEYSETSLSLAWNESLEVSASADRINEIIDQVPTEILRSEFDFGINQGLIITESPTQDRVSGYLEFETAERLNEFKRHFAKALAENYPLATFQINPPTNPFNLIFPNSQPWLEARWRIPSNDYSSFIRTVVQQAFTISPENDPSTLLFEEQQLSIHWDRLDAYNISLLELEKVLKSSLSSTAGETITLKGRQMPIIIKADNSSLTKTLREIFISTSDGGALLPLSYFVEIIPDSKTPIIKADVQGPYLPSSWDKLTELETQAVIDDIFYVQDNQRAEVSLSGKYFEGGESLQQLIFMVGLSIFLLYFILAAQFESFLQPFLVILIIPLGISGGMLGLWLTHTPLDTMAGLGIIMGLGIMVNDAIIKLDGINRNRNQLQLKAQYKNEDLIITKAIQMAGESRLRPILLTTLTTTLAIGPIFFFSGIGAELQMPLAITLIFVLCVGTFSSLFIMPVLYKKLIK